MVTLARKGTPSHFIRGSSSCRKAQTLYKTKLFAKVLHLFSPQKYDRLVICYENGDDAIEKSHSITWRQALTKMPLKKSEWIGENWIVRNEAEKQLKASREQKTRSVMKLMPKSNGKTTTFVQMPMSETYYIYNPEYRNKLINGIKNKETSLKTSKSDLKLDLPKLKNIQKQNY